MARRVLRKSWLVVVLMLIVAACGAESAGEAAAELESEGAAAAEAPTTSEADESPATTEPAPEPTTTTTTLAPTTTTIVSLDPDDAVPLESVVGGSIRGDGWLVDPGVYTQALGDLEFTFFVTSPVVWFDYEGIVFGPDRSSPSNDLLVLTEFVGVIPPDKAAEHAPHDPIVPTYAEPIPDDLGTWLNSVSQLETSAPMTVDTGDVGGTYWDVSVSGDGGTFHCGFGECVGGLVQETVGVFVFFEDAAFRLWQFDDVGNEVFGFLQSGEETLEEMTELADMIIGGMTVAPAG